MRMPFGKKSKVRGGQRESDVGRRYESTDNSLPGNCGYLSWGVQSDHPARFTYVRPDGREDDDPRDLPDDELDAVPLSRRPAPRGFFGP